MINPGKDCLAWLSSFHMIGTKMYFHNFVTVHLTNTNCSPSESQALWQSLGRSSEGGRDVLHLRELLLSIIDWKSSPNLIANMAGQWRRVLSQISLSLEFTQQSSSQQMPPYIAFLWWRVLREKHGFNKISPHLDSSLCTRVLCTNLNQTDFVLLREL